MIVLLYYKYVAVPDAVKETADHRALCERLGLKGRILISSEGINGTCSGTDEAIRAYKKALDTHPLFSGIAFKESQHPTHAFKKLFVRHRPEIVTLKADVDAAGAAPYISPEDLHTALEQNEDIILVDMRNAYEAEIGAFAGAVTLPIKNFRDVPTQLAALAPLKDKNVVTYCTGGIRCEKASALLRKHGFSRVRQLEGGIVKYCEAFPDGHFLGSLFVFDERRSMRFPGATKKTYTSCCHYCGTASDRQIDCSDTSCHALFVCCEACETLHGGSCKDHKHSRQCSTSKEALVHSRHVDISKAGAPS